MSISFDDCMGSYPYFYNYTQMGYKKFMVNNHYSIP